MGQPGECQAASAGTLKSRPGECRQDLLVLHEEVKAIMGLRLDGEWVGQHLQGLHKEDGDTVGLEQVEGGPGEGRESSNTASLRVGAWDRWTWRVPGSVCWFFTKLTMVAPQALATLRLSPFLSLQMTMTPEEVLGQV